MPKVETRVPWDAQSLKKSGRPWSTSEPFLNKHQEFWKTTSARASLMGLLQSARTTEQEENVWLSQTQGTHSIFSSTPSRLLPAAQMSRCFWGSGLAQAALHMFITLWPFLLPLLSSVISISNPLLLHPRMERWMDLQHVTFCSSPKWKTSMDSVSSRNLPTSFACNNRHIPWMKSPSSSFSLWMHTAFGWVSSTLKSVNSCIMCRCSAEN